MPIPIVKVLTEPHSWLEQASWISQAVIASTAVVGSIFAGRQLVDVKRASQATLLLELDARFDADAMRDARNKFDDLSKVINAAVNSQFSQTKDAEKRLRVCEAWTKKLSELRSANDFTYMQLLGWLGFFETLGVMVARKYISEEDAFRLFKGPLIDVWDCFAVHISERSKEAGVPEGMFEHALQLGKKASEA